jgi:hypothetical protein
MKIKYIMVIEFLVFVLYKRALFSASVSQECTASSFRVTDLLRVGVVGMGGKKMCQLHREV